MFYGFQTLRQLLPWSIEYRGPRPFEVAVPVAHITDHPRYGWRGAFLDVSRHFFSPDDVKRYIDLIAMYKFNRLHLHLTDDQGWRIEITSWPNLTTHGGSTETKGGPGGFYTKKDYADLLAYASDRFIMVIPESTCRATAMRRWRRIRSSIATAWRRRSTPASTSASATSASNKEITFKFLDDVLGRAGGR